MRTTVEIRAFEPEDAEAILAIVEEFLDEIDPGRHTPRGIELQLAENFPRSW
jgi:hypothetical protein